ncbi:hypothetical protein Cseg_0964 [Caulobacter segnis ATCC 21756]|uniref:Uncharacterized protein n=1 Tax=Caulobacter segnis (strain ATCC 21756 / DSM 7131 / JCM 7823 / NBRC 15250 / LMG 17158 / TK0059) TaxID=509190 RepID=D5VF51_CAUST|nr:hypothetical protein Cseg_0964 [Caulobacter segnis ATCC 21756]
MANAMDARRYAYRSAALEKRQWPYSIEWEPRGELAEFFHGCLAAIVDQAARGNLDAARQTLDGALQRAGVHRWGAQTTTPLNAP